MANLDTADDLQTMLMAVSDCIISDSRFGHDTGLAHRMKSLWTTERDEEALSDEVRSITQDHSELSSCALMVQVQETADAQRRWLSTRYVLNCNNVIKQLKETGWSGERARSSGVPPVTTPADTEGGVETAHSGPNSPSEGRLQRVPSPPKTAVSKDTEGGFELVTCHEGLARIKAHWLAKGISPTVPIIKDITELAACWEDGIQASKLRSRLSALNERIGLSEANATGTLEDRRDIYSLVILDKNIVKKTTQDLNMLVCAGPVAGIGASLATGAQGTIIWDQ